MQIILDLVQTTIISSILELYYFSPQIRRIKVIIFKIQGFSLHLTSLKSEVTEEEEGDIFILNTYREDCRTTSDSKHKWKATFTMCFSFSFQQVLQVPRLLLKKASAVQGEDSALCVASAWQGAQHPAATSSPCLATGHSFTVPAASGLPELPLAPLPGFYWEAFIKHLAN